MRSRDRPHTIEGDWDRFYLEFPDVYDRFAQTTPHGVNALHDMFDLTNKMVLDIGSGTGRSTFELATYAQFVIGLEPWAPMRALAVTKARARHIPNVAFVNGRTEDMPFQSDSADVIVSVYGFPFWFIDAGHHGRTLAERYLADGLRIVRPGGYLINVGSAPMWDAGELTHVIVPNADGAARVHALMTSLGFSFTDRLVHAEYGSLQEALETYGFIYGRPAIEYLIANQQHAITWILRIHYRQVDGARDGSA